MNFANFFAELKRRNVYKVAVAYAVVGWLIAQISTQIFPFLEIPNWVVRLIIVLIAIGFPIALVIAWAFEATPEGIKRTEIADAMLATAGQKKRTWIYVVVIGVAFSIGLFLSVVIRLGMPPVRLAPNCRQSRSRCCRSIISVATPTTLISLKACRTKSSLVWPRWPI